MARIVGHPPVEEPEARRRAARDVAEARPHRVIRLPAQGRAAPEVPGVANDIREWSLGDTEN